MVHQENMNTYNEIPYIGNTLRIEDHFYDAQSDIEPQAVIDADGENECFLNSGDNEIPVPMYTVAEIYIPEEKVETIGRNGPEPISCLLERRKEVMERKGQWTEIEDEDKFSASSFEVDYTNDDKECVGDSKPYRKEIPEKKDSVENDPYSMTGDKLEKERDGDFQEMYKQLKTLFKRIRDSLEEKRKQMQEAVDQLLRGAAAKTYNISSENDQRPVSAERVIQKSRTDHLPILLMLILTMGISGSLAVDVEKPPNISFDARVQGFHSNLSLLTRRTNDTRLDSKFLCNLKDWYKVGLVDYTDGYNELYDGYDELYNRYDELYDHLKELYDRLNELYDRYNELYNGYYELKDHYNELYERYNELCDYYDALYDPNPELYDCDNEQYGRFNELYKRFNELYECFNELYHGYDELFDRYDELYTLKLHFVLLSWLYDEPHGYYMYVGHKPRNDMPVLYKMYLFEEIVRSYSLGLRLTDLIYYFYFDNLTDRNDLEYLRYPTDRHDLEYLSHPTSLFIKKADNTQHFYTVMKPTMKPHMVINMDDLKVYSDKKHISSKKIKQKKKPSSSDDVNHNRQRDGLMDFLCVICVLLVTLAYICAFAVIWHTVISIFNDTLKMEFSIKDFVAVSTIVMFTEFVNIRTKKYVNSCELTEAFKMLTYAVLYAVLFAVLCKELHVKTKIISTTQNGMLFSLMKMIMMLVLTLWFWSLYLGMVIGLVLTDLGFDSEKAIQSGRITLRRLLGVIISKKNFVLSTLKHVEIVKWMNGSTKKIRTFVTDSLLDKCPKFNFGCFKKSSDNVKGESISHKSVKTKSHDHLNEESFDGSINSKIRNTDDQIKNISVQELKEGKEMVDQMVQCSLINDLLLAVTINEGVQTSLDRDPVYEGEGHNKVGDVSLKCDLSDQKELGENCIDADESISLDQESVYESDSSMELEDHFEKIEPERSLENGCIKIKSAHCSTQIVAEAKNIDIHGETSLKTVSEASLSNSIHDGNTDHVNQIDFDHTSEVDEDLIPGYISQCSEPSLHYDPYHDAHEKVWQPSSLHSFLHIQDLHENEKVLNSLKLDDSYDSIKLDDSYDSIDGKSVGSCATSNRDEKNNFSIGSGQSSISYHREQRKCYCHTNVSHGNHIADLHNVCTEHNTCHGITGNLGYSHKEKVKDDSDVDLDTLSGNTVINLQREQELNSRDKPNVNDDRDVNLEILSSSTVIDLQKQQESKFKGEMSVKKTYERSTDEEYIKKQVVEASVKNFFKDNHGTLNRRQSRRQPSCNRRRQSVKRLLRTIIHHDRHNKVQNILPVHGPSENAYSDASRRFNDTVTDNRQVINSRPQLTGNSLIDNRPQLNDNGPLVTTQNGAVIGIALERPPVAMEMIASSSTLNNYFTKVLTGYQFDQDESMAYEMLRVQSFQDLPASCQASPLRMARTGFFSRGHCDEVTCFSCGAQYKNWSSGDLPSEVHKRISPNCRMVMGTESRNVPITPQTNGFSNHSDSLPNNTSGLIQTPSTVHHDGDISTQTAPPENRPLTRQEIERANTPDRTPQVTQNETRPPPEGAERRPAQRDQAEELGIVLDRPKYPSYAQLNVRVSTFSGWPGYLDQSPRDMALAGFFYAGYNDYCRCFYCGGGLRNWDAGDDPWVEHARWFPKCSFVRQNRGHRFVEIIMKRQQEMQSSGGTGGSRTQTTGADNTSNSGSSASLASAPQTPTQTPPQPAAPEASADVNADAIESITELGYTEQVIRRAIDIMKRNNPGKNKFEATEILEVVFTISDDDLTSTSNAAVSQTQTATNTNPPESTGTNQQQNSTGARSRHGGKTKGKKSKQKQKTSGNATESTSQSSSAGDMSLPSLSVSSLETPTAAGGAVQDPQSNQAISESEIRSLQEENIQLKEQVMCKICMDKNVSIAFLPCGHLACCIDCAPAMRKCPMCRVFIKGTVKTYLA